METRNLYKYAGETEGQCIVSPVKIANAPFTPMYRLVAAENKVVTKDNGTTVYDVIDIETADLPNWKEIDKPAEKTK